MRVPVVVGDLQRWAWRRLHRRRLMRMNQYVYFQLWSRTMPADEIARRIGIEPDEVLVRGSKAKDPDRPGYHSWGLYAREPNWGVDDLVGLVVDRIAPVAPLVRELVDSGEVSAQLTIVRYFNDRNGHDEEFETVHEDGHAFEKLPGQHQMLGWHLELEVLELLASMKAEIDVDEYGWPMTSEYGAPPRTHRSWRRLRRS